MKNRACLFIFGSLVLFNTLLASCAGEQKTAEEKTKDQIAKVYNLKIDEVNFANANAKKYFERQWPTNSGKTVQGTFIECRPSDSNFNGYVTCFGFVADVNTGNLVNQKRYCGYRKDLIGCSDEDTVKPN